MRANREQVWELLRLLKDLPEPAHRKIVQGILDITGIQVWPGRAIELVALLFRIGFRVEQISGEFPEYMCPNITPGHTVEQDGDYLQVENPELRREFTMER
jgi:hypothetical protein